MYARLQNSGITRCSCYDPRCRFTNIQKQLPAPFVVYADFESILEPVDKDVDTTQGVEVGGESSSHDFQEHVPCSFDPNFTRPLAMYRGENAAEKFVRDLQQEAQKMFDEYIATPKPTLLTATELRSFNNATTCYICTKPLGDDKVRDHCHIVGSYRGIVWTAFGCRTMADYHDIYLQVDVLLLTDFFERFRTTCL